METHPRRLLTIITEAVIERSLVADARRFGAHGYTVMDVRGGGMTGEREGAWEADRSIELQVVCAADVAERIAEHVLERYAPHYAVSLYLSDVQVFRAQKY
ncbi:MAG TPA: transcriptional regulator [Burkholderiaceae bacterium]|nr:transcriptional regulator [Burkholderiaceae bacterium]